MPETSIEELQKLKPNQTEMGHFSVGLAPMAAFCLPTEPRGSLTMKRLVAWLMSGVVLAGLLLTLVLAPAAQAADRRNEADDKIAARAGKIDLNNCSVRRFQEFPGMYPTLAGKIVTGGPYNSVEDVLKLDLTARQKDLIEQHIDRFTVTPPAISLNEGFDRINDGQYR